MLTQGDAVPAPVEAQVRNVRPHGQQAASAEIASIGPREKDVLMSGFRKFANTISRVVGSRWAFLAAAGIVLAWAVVGSACGFSEIWLLLINTVATIITFLMVFLIQNAQNRHYQAIQLKLDELIRGIEGPRTHLVNLENLAEEELSKLEQEFQRLRKLESAKVSPAAGLDSPSDRDQRLPSAAEEKPG
jgi:low affinity Fe/Cu permease